MSEEKSGYGGGYGKRPLWQWILLYVVIAGVLYGIVYYFVFARNGYGAAPAADTSSATQESSVY